MTKSIFPNFKKWTTDEKRLLVILLLTLIYPVFVTSFYALYLFVILPAWVSPSSSFREAHQKGWYHLYWVLVSMFWVIICAIILPLFKKEKAQHALHMGDIESSPYKKKMHTEPVIKIEVKDSEDSQSKSSRKSGNSSCSSKKDGSVLDVGKEESLERSRESLSKSCTSLDRKKLTQSGEFLNDFMSTIKSEETIKSETVCEVHAEENKDHKTGSNSDRESVEKERNHQSPDISLKPAEVETSQQKYSEDSNGSEGPSDNKKIHLKDSDTSSDSSSDEDPEKSVVTQETKSPQTSSPLKISEAMVEQNEEVEILEVTEEVDKLDSDAPQTRPKKAIQTVDTSRASGYYECSLPSPKPVEVTSTQSNKVFLYVNPDTAATEENILLSHGGEVEESGVKDTDL